MTITLWSCIDLTGRIVYWVIYKDNYVIRFTRGTRLKKGDYNPNIYFIHILIFLYIMYKYFSMKKTI